METEIATNNNKSLKSSTTAIASTSNNNNNNLKENNNNGKKEKEQRDRGVQENGHGKMDGGAAGKANVEKKPIRLSSPVGGQPINWHWSEKEKNNIGIEVIELVKFACFHYPELEIPSLKSKLEIVDHTNYDQVRSLAKKFNKAVREKTQNPKENPSKPRHKEFFHQILTRCYNRAVENEKALNKHYEAFSSQTYGETSYERMQMIIEELKPDSKDVFVDLGSGVGQLVVHMAGMTSVQKAVGIEISPLPSKFGRKLETEFKKWMNWFALPFQPFELKQGDFLSEEHRKLIIEEATIIFINNYAFKSDLETRIKRELLSDLRDGTRIISTKEYVSVNKQNAAITDRQLSDISVITDVTEMKPCPNPCSWTSAYVPYYLHTINRAKLENYFLQLRNPSLRAKSSDTGSRRSSTPNSKASNSRESSVGRNMRDKSSENGRINGNGEDAWSVRYGPTTRRKWNEYVNDLEMQKKKKRGGGQKTSSASSSENASTGTSTPAPTSGSSNSQLTNSSTNSSEMATTTTTTANVGQATSVAATSTDAIPSIETEKEENKAAILVEKEIEMATIPSIEPAEHKHQMMEENGTINPLLEMKTIEFPSTIAGTSSNQNQSTPATVTVPLESNREIASPKFEPISPVKQQSSSTKRASTKRSYERKDRSATTSSTGGTGRGRPRKTDKVGSHATPKLPRLSDDARDGIELMHQMTCAVQSGKPMDTASILADMANQNNTKMCLSGSGASMKNTLMDISPPFPNLENTAAGPSTSTSSSAIRHQNQPDLDVQKQQQYSSKYPGLNKFIDGFRRVYENFFDEFYSTNQQKSSMVKNDDSLHSQQSDPTIADQFHNYRTIFDQTPVKRPVDELAEIGSGRIRPREISMNGTAWPSTTEEHGSRISELQKRIQNRRKQIANKWAEMQNEIVLLDADIDALAAECSQQDETNQHIAHQQQLQQQQLVQQQHQQQLIAAAQAQLAAAAAQAQEQQSVAAAAATVVQQAQAAQQVTQAAATVSNQLELMINEMREHYNRQLAAQHLLNQISSLGLLNVIAPQEIAALQNIANGNTMNLNGVHQMSPVAAAAAAIMHSPVASSTQPTLPNSLQQLCSSGAQQQIQNQIENNGQSVQNFLAALDTMNNKNGPKGSNLSTSNVNGTVNDANISANVAGVAAELAHTGLNYANAVNTQPSVHSFSLHQVSQNFSCPQTIPSSSASAEITSQIARESTVAEVVAEVAALPGTRKPFKPRPPRTGGGNKRNGQNAQKQQQQQTMEDPKKQEEIERQIQDIVAKALEVDSAAKSAEKDRKSRSGEKRTSREKTIGNGGLPLNTSSSSLPTTSSSLCSMADINKSPLIATVQPLPARAPPPNSIEYQVKAENAIMQNFLSTAQKQLAQQQAASILQNGGGMTVAINPSNNITPCGTPNSHHQPSTPATILDGKRTPLSGNNNNLGNSTIDFRQAMATLTPTVQSPSIGIGGIHQQPQHFTFTPSSVSLAIQGMASNTFSSPSTGLQISASKLIQTPPTSSPSAKPVTGVGTFLHPGESCSPPFISLNLPPNTCALGPPPTNVVVKVESKVPAPGSGGGGHAGLP